MTFFSNLLPEWKNSLLRGETPISVQMIVRDEEPRLARTLRSLIALSPQEVIVADTGSTDGTKDIASFFGCRVIDLPWTDHFANARNAVLDISSCGLCMWIDADEELEERSARLIRKRINAGEFADADFHMIRFIEPPMSMHQCRIWRNKPEARWVGRVHEKIPMVTGPQKRHSDCIIQQFPDERRRSKHERNLRLLAMAMKEDPTNHDLFFHAAILEHMIGNDQSARKYAHRYIASAPIDDSKTRGYMLYLLAYLATYIDHDYQHATQLLTAALAEDPCAAELWCLLGNVYWWLGRHSDAYRFYENALELGKHKRDILWIVDLTKYDAYPRERIAELQHKGVTPSCAPEAPYSGFGIG